MRVSTAAPRSKPTRANRDQAHRPRTVGLFHFPARPRGRFRRSPSYEFLNPLPCRSPLTVGGQKALPGAERLTIVAWHKRLSTQRHASRDGATAFHVTRTDHHAERPPGLARTTFRRRCRTR